MLELWNSLCLRALDPLFGNLRDSSTDLTLVAVACATSAVLVLSRKFLSNQDLLRRAYNDRRKLKTLYRNARAQGDREAAKRFRATKSAIPMLVFRQEGRPLLAALLPVAIIATWCFLRLDVHAPQEGEDIRVHARVPVSMAGELVHVVPLTELESEQWIQPVVAVTNKAPAFGRATWTVRAAASEEPYKLVFRLGQRSLEHELIVGQRGHAATVIDHGNRVATRVEMRPVKLLNLVPGIPAVGFPPWLVGYLLLVLPINAAFKRLFRVY